MDIVPNSLSFVFIDNDCTKKCYELITGFTKSIFDEFESIEYEIYDEKEHTPISELVCGKSKDSVPMEHGYAYVRCRIPWDFALTIKKLGGGLNHEYNDYQPYFARLCEKYKCIIDGYYFFTFPMCQRIIVGPGGNKWLDEQTTTHSYERASFEKKLYDAIAEHYEEAMMHLTLNGEVQDEEQQS